MKWIESVRNVTYKDMTVSYSSQIAWGVVLNRHESAKPLAFYLCCEAFVSIFPFLMTLELCTTELQ